MNTNLDALLKRREQLDARIQAAEARLRKQRRATDTRRKVLVGAAVLAAIEGGDDDLRARIVRVLDTGLTRERDRAVLTDLLPGGEQT